MKTKNMIFLILIIFMIIIFYFNYYIPVREEILNLQNSVENDRAELKKLEKKVEERKAEIKKWENSVKDIEYIKNNYVLNDRVLLRFKIEELLNSSGIIPDSEKIGYKKIKNSDFGILSFEFNTKADPRLFELFKKIRQKRLLIGLEYLRVDAFPNSSAKIRLRGLVYEEN